VDVAPIWLRIVHERLGSYRRARITSGLRKPSDLVQGTLDMLLLKVLALEPMSGFAVSQRIEAGVRRRASD
jgi:hypothetical protein